MPTIITARTLLTDVGSIEYPVLTVADNGTLEDISSDPISLAHETDTLTAGFFDIHTHGALGHDVMSASPAELHAMQRFLAERGVAYYLPTTVTASIDSTLHALESLANAIERGPNPVEAQPVGIHLEGPFLSHAKRGVHPPDLLQPPSLELFTRFYEASRGHISVLTIAPEPNAWLAQNTPKPVILSEASEQREGEQSKDPATARSTHAAGPFSTSAAPLPSSAALDLIRHATSLGVRVSLGHSNATAAQTRAAVFAGAASATHTFNAMRPLDHREPGILGITLDDPSLYAELICDGIHVAPELVRMWLRSKGTDRAILITDAMSAAGMPNGNYKLGALDVHVSQGRAVLADDLARGKETLAGSVLTMDRAVSNLQRFTQTSLADATRLASHNPAALLGRPELTRLDPGSPANLNRFDTRGRLVATYIHGDLID